MTHGSLFSGIGGFELAAQWMGWENRFHCEINPFGRKVLNYYWPKSKSYEDITKTDFTIWRGRIDILTGGFPCQPFSQAGKRKGTEDERHLWPEMLRAIREISPRWIVAENVPGILSIESGLVFKQICTEMENAGYEIQVLELPAGGVQNAPHKRERVWIVAHRNITNPNSIGKQRLPINPGSSHFSGQRGACIKKAWNARTIAPWSSFPTQSPICTGNDGLSPELDGITLSKHRSESIKAVGNAIVPQVAYQIFQSIASYDRTPRT